MKNLIAVALCVSALCLAQTAPKPTYVMGGLAYNQYTGASAFVSGIVPEGQGGMYASAVVDLVPQKFVDPKTGRVGYVVSGSTRFGQHRELYRNGPSALLIGGDVGPTFSQQPVATGFSLGGTNVGISGSFTVTYVRMIREHIGVAVPVRMLYMSGAGPNGAGAWNPVVEVGVVFKP